jgi:hypothetical protein
MKLTTKFVTATCIALSALLAPALAQEGIKRINELRDARAS